MKNIFAVGTGPGASEYLTLQAIKTIQNADIIFAPNNKNKHLALDSVKEFIKEQRIVLLDFTMGKVKEKDYQTAAKKIIEQTEENTNSVFLTIGDPMLYSTFLYLLSYLKNENINLKIIPGITSYNVAAAISQKPLAKKGEVLVISDHINSDILKTASSIALLKTSKQKNLIIKEFEKNNFNYLYIKRATMKEETILKDKDEILNDNDYISLILASKEK